MKIGVKGFQSIKKGVVEALPGEIIGIRGANNSGKSAFVRAVRAAIVNSTEKETINEEVGKIAVVIKTKDHLIKWEKNKTNTYYWMDGKSHQKLNRAPLQEVFPQAGFLVEKEGSEIMVPSVVPEGTLIFPFSLSSSVAFKIFSRFISTPKIGGIIKDVKMILKEDQESLGKVRIRLDVLEVEHSKNKRLLEEETPKEELTRLRDRVIKYNVAVRRWEEREKKFSRCHLKLKEVRKALEVFDSERLVEFRDKLEVHVTRFKKYREIVDLVGRLEKKKWEQLVCRRELTELKVFEKKNSLRLEKMEKVVDLIRRFELIVSSRRTKEIENLKFEIVRLVKDRSQFEFCPLCERVFQDSKDLYI